MVNRINLEIARKAIDVVVEKALEHPDRITNGGPIAVTVVGPDGRRIASASMDGVMPVSIGISENKAYTAVIGQRPTVIFEKMEKEDGLNPRNFGDPKWTNFGGAIPIEVYGDVLGAVGVSGRRSSKQKFSEDVRKNSPPQDHELAEIGVDKVIEEFL